MLQTISSPTQRSVAAAFDRETLVTAHLPKVKFIAERMAAKLPSSVESDDLYGAGVLGLLDAVERFDPTRGTAFTTFAEMRVRGAILDSLRALDWASRRTRRRTKAVQAAYAELEKINGRAATEEEAAAHLGITLANLQEILTELRGLTVTELDAAAGDNLNALETFCDTAESPLDRCENRQRRERLAKAVDRLPHRQRQVIALYYVEELTMKEIGAVLGVTESRVSQLRTQAIIRLRAHLQ